MEIFSSIYQKINLPFVFGKNKDSEQINKPNQYDIENIMNIPVYTHRIYKKYKKNLNENNSIYNNCEEYKNN